MKKLLLILPFVVLGIALTLHALPIQSREEPVADPSAPEERETHLILDGRRYTYTGNEEDIQIQDDVLTILRGGAYRISGTLKEGSIRVHADPADTVRLILDGASITSSYHAPLRIDRAACVIVETTPDSVNTLTDAARSVDQSDPILPLAALECHANLILRGEGVLAISGRAACAIAASSTVWISSGKISLSAPETALWVRDQLRMENGALTLRAAKYGVSAHAEGASMGAIEITGGQLSASCSEVALSAGRSILVSGGSASIQAPTVYQCRRQIDDKTVSGTIHVTAVGFPKG